MQRKRYAHMILAIPGTIAMIFIENTAFAYRGGSCWWGFGVGPMGGWGMGGFGPLVMLLFWGLLITGAVLLIRWAIQAFRNQPADSRNSSTPLDILRKRFASGEIDEEEFKRMQQALGRTSE